MTELLSKGSPSWVFFEECFHNEVGRFNYWTTVAEIDNFERQNEDTFREHKGILSYLAKNEKSIIDWQFKNEMWRVSYNIGNVDIEESDNGVIFNENLGNEEIQVFITLKKSIGNYPNAWKLWPTFENYFDLRADEKGNLVDPYNDELVAKIPFPAEKGPVSIRTDYLQDYLAARNMVLIRQHDYTRLWEEYIEDAHEPEKNGICCKKEWGCYNLYVSNSQKNSMKRFSRLLFKDFVAPYSQAGTVGGKRRVKVQAEDYPEFIIEKKLDGTEIKKRPDPDDLIPVYFNPKVLKRYYEEPKRYSVGFHAPGMGSVAFLDKWIIPIGRNDEGLIILWLGDLIIKGLSGEEINHWRAHNVPPRGGMAMDFWNAQMQCNPSKDPSLESRLIDCKHSIIKYMDSNEKKIYKPYEGPDVYIEKTLREPLYDEHYEFQESIILLSKMFIEYLDIKSIKKDLPDERKRDAKGNEFTQIALLANWLKFVVHIPIELAEKIKKSLQNIQMVRSKTGVAHRFSDSSYQEVIQKLDLFDDRITGKSLYCAVANPLADNLEELCNILGIGNDLWWIKYKEN